MAEEHAQRVFVKEDSSALIRCDSCGLVETVRMQDLAALSAVVRIRCACAAVFPVRFEYRKFYRKPTNLEGTYRVFSDEQDVSGLSLARKAINCRIENISMHGAGFSALGQHRIEKNARLLLGFTLDTPNHPWIEKTGVVRLVEGPYIGLRFDEPASTDRALGFYLMP